MLVMYYVCILYNRGCFSLLCYSRADFSSQWASYVLKLNYITCVKPSYNLKALNNKRTLNMDKT